MKKLLPLSFVLLCELCLACSGFTKSFCVTHASRPNDVVVKGTVISTAANSIQLKVLEVLKGVENNSVIIIWDGTDFDCNGPYSMKASGMGSLGDTIVAVLPKITGVENTWDVPGDYRRPNYFFHEPVLKIKNGILKGLINGSYDPLQPSPILYEMNYSEFKNYWIAHQADCATFVGVSEQHEQLKAFIRQDGSRIHGFIPEGGAQTIQVISLQGNVIAELKVSEEFELDMETYAHGMYLISVVSSDGREFRQKVIR